MKLLLIAACCRLSCALISVNCRYVYWSNDISSGARVERAGLDGANRHTVVASVPHLSSLTIDYSQRRLYWLRADCKCIESSDMSGDNRQLLVTGLEQPFGIVQYSNQLYWTDWKRKSIEFVDKLTGSDHQVLLDRLNFPIHLSIFHMERQLGTSVSFSDYSPSAFKVRKYHISNKSCLNML